jgi:phage N-6-adenine-methyltransferase
MAKIASATVTRSRLIIVAGRNDRPGPDVPVRHSKRSLNQLVQDAQAAEKRIANLERTQRRTAKTLLFENLDQALRIEAAVERGQSVAAFARRAKIEERRAQRLYKLAARCDRIREEVQASEAEYGDDFVCPSWKQYLRAEPTEHEPKDDEIELAKELIVDALDQELGVARARIAELQAANKIAEAALEESDTKLQALKNRGLYGMFGRGDPERETPKWLFDPYDREFRLGLDVAASTKNTKCSRFFTREANGLVQIRSGNIWLNPPYSAIEPWCKKAWEYAQTGNGVVVALLPLWPTATWFIKYAIHGHIRLLTARVGFVGTTTAAPFDLMVVVWTRTSQCKDGRLHVIMEDVPDPKRAARQARAAAKAR